MERHVCITACEYTAELFSIMSEGILSRLADVVKLRLFSYKLAFCIERLTISLTAYASFVTQRLLSNFRLIIYIGLHGELQNCFNAFA